MDRQCQDRYKKYFKQLRDGTISVVKERPKFVYSSEFSQNIVSNSDLSTRLYTLSVLSARTCSSDMDDHQMCQLLREIDDLCRPPITLTPTSSITGLTDKAAPANSSDVQSHENKHFLSILSRSSIVHDFVTACLCTIVNEQRRHMGTSRVGMLNLTVSGLDPGLTPVAIMSCLLPRKVELLSALTDNGRDLFGIESVIFYQLTVLLMRVHEANVSSECQRVSYQLLTDCVKFNAAFLDTSAADRLIRFLYVDAKHSELTVQCCLSTLDALICYGDIPDAVVTILTCWLTRLVCAPCYTRAAWRILRHLLGTSYGAAALDSLVSVMEHRVRDTCLLKGSVFVCAAALWSGTDCSGSRYINSAASQPVDQRVASLHVLPGSVLPAFESALESRRPAVVYEVMLELSRLVNGEQSQDLLPHNWSCLLHMCDTVHAMIGGDGCFTSLDRCNSSSDGELLTSAVLLSLRQRLESLLVTILAQTVRLRYGEEGGDVMCAIDEYQLDSVLVKCSRLLPTEMVVDLVMRLAGNASLTPVMGGSDENSSSNVFGNGIDHAVGGANNSGGGANEIMGGANHSVGGANEIMGGANQTMGRANNSGGGGNNILGGANCSTSGAENQSQKDDQQSVWLMSLRSLVEHYFVHEHRVRVRLAICDVAEQVWRGYRSLQPRAVWRNVMRPMAVALSCVSCYYQLAHNVSTDAVSSTSAVDNSEQSQLCARMLKLLILVASSSCHVTSDDCQAFGDLSDIASECVEFIQTGIERVISLAEKRVALSELVVSEASEAATACLQLFELQLVEEQLENGGVTAQLLAFLFEQMERVYRLPSEWKVALRQLHEVWLFWWLRLCCDCHGRVGLLPITTGNASITNNSRSEAVSVSYNGEVESDGLSSLDFTSVDASSIIYSRSLLLESTNEKFPESTSTRIPASNYHRLWSSLILSERDFRLLSVTLSALPVVLRSPRLLLANCSSGAAVDYLAAALCQLSVRLDASFCSRLLRLPVSQQDSSDSPGVTTSVAASACCILRAQLVTALASLTAYHPHLSALHQRRLVACLETGLRTRSAPQCVHALSVCALSVRESMYRMIGDVLTSLSKLSTTVSLATSVTELLSTLVCAPALCNSFSSQQYRCVFAIALPYTNPLRFGHYVVSLAHHVLVVWFVKCKPSCRLSLVRYIVAGLRSNMMDMRPLVEKQGTNQLVGSNDDSTGRRRSSSLSDHAGGGGGGTSDTPMLIPRPRPRPRQTREDAAPSSAGRGVSADTLMFAQQLAETCVDLMARYIGPSLAVVHRNSAFMQRRLSNSVTRTWIIDNRYVTVRVAGCGSPVTPGSDSLCLHCSANCRSLSTVSALSSSSSAVMSRLTPTRPAQDSASSRLSMPGDGIGTAGGSVREEEREGGGGYRGARRRHTSVPQACLTAPSAGMSSAVNRTNSKTDSVEVSACDDNESPLCRCWCQGWGELVVRRPSGNMAWLIRLRNRRLRLSTPTPPADLSGLKSARSCVSCCPAASAVSSQLDSDTARGQCSDECGARHGQQSSRPASGSFATLAQFGGVNGADVTSPSTVVDVPDDTPPELLPQQIFLQLFHSPLVNMSELFSVTSLDPTGEDHTSIPIGLSPSPCSSEGGTSVVAMLPADETTERSLKLFDHIPAREVHKIGVLYVGRDQFNDEAAILQNRAGSLRYDKFVEGLGRLVNIRHCDSSCVYLGGLSQDGRDGDYTVVWEDHLLQMMFHVATMMPVLDSDERCNNKKLHVGNVFVLIVYNESGYTLRASPISGHFGYACVVVEPLCHGLNLVSVITKPILKTLFGDRPATLVSDQCVSLVARQMALHADLASLIHRHGQKHPEPYASNWLERLRFIRRHRAKLLASPSLSSLSSSRGHASSSSASLAAATGSSSNNQKQQQQQQRSTVCLDFTKLFD